MPQRIYNTLSAKVDPFTPVGGNKVRMYVCGPTVYDLPHIGHARSYVFFDAVRRFLTSQGFDVTFQQNFSDIDEKITAKATQAGRDPLKVAEDYIGEFLADMDLLRVDRADIYSRSSEHVSEIIEATRRLLDLGAAYQVGTFVYFDHRKTKTFGSLTHQDIRSMIAREASDPSSPKRSLLDFALWQEAKPGDPAWNSPWGRGKPGWHIECYVMSREHLGHPLDIKGGGRDLIYPHHESEAAICAALSRKPYARFYMHNGFVTLGDTKMSKSLRNVVPVREALASAPAGVLRLWLLSVPYRDPLAWKDGALKQAKSRYETMTQAHSRIGAWAQELDDGASPVMKPGQVPRKEISEIEGQEARFRKAMESDFDTPSALDALERVLVLGAQLSGDRSREVAVRRVAASIALASAASMNAVLQVIEA